VAKLAGKIEKLEPKIEAAEKKVERLEAAWINEKDEKKEAKFRVLWDAARDEVKRLDQEKHDLRKEKELLLQKQPQQQTGK